MSIVFFNLIGDIFLFCNRELAIYDISYRRGCFYCLGFILQKYYYKIGEAIKHCIIELMKQVLPMLVNPLYENWSYTVGLFLKSFLLLYIKVYSYTDRS